MINQHNNHPNKKYHIAFSIGFCFGIVFGGSELGFPHIADVNTLDFLSTLWSRIISYQ